IFNFQSSICRSPFAICHLPFAIAHPPPPCRSQAETSWHANLGLWTLDFGPWALNLGLWTSKVNFQFTHPYYLLALVPALAWVIWFAWQTDVQVSAWRRWSALVIRVLVVLALILAVAGLQWLLPVEGMNVFFVLDRSDSVPSPQQESARDYVNKVARQMHKVDKAGVIV